MSGIIASGVGSGLDVKSLVEGLVAAQTDPQRIRIDKAEMSLQSKFSGVGLLASAVSEFRDASLPLKEPKSFDVRRAESSDHEVFTATAETEAALGDHTIEVTQLAKAHKIISSALPSADQGVGKGSLELYLGAQHFSVVIDDLNNSLTGIRDAINQAEDNLGIHAEVLNTEHGAELLFSAEQTGTGNTINVVVTEDESAPGLGILNFQHQFFSPKFESDFSVVGQGKLRIAVGKSYFEIDVDSAHETLSGIKDLINQSSQNLGVSAEIDKSSGSSRLMLVGQDTITLTNENSGLSKLFKKSELKENAVLETVTQAANAKIKIDGQVISSAGNTFSEPLMGIHLTLHDNATPGSTALLTVKRNNSSISNMISKFVEGYNALLGTINDLIKYDPETKEKGAFLGDALLNGLHTKVHENVTQILSSSVGKYNSLSSLGIVTARDGSLSLDEASLNQAVDNDLKDVRTLFSDADGVGAILCQTLDNYSQLNGLLDSKKGSIKDQLSAIDKQREQFEMKKDKLEERLLKQFGALDALVSKLRSQSDFLSQQLSSMPINRLNRNK